MSDEAQFHLNGFINKQNYLYWLNKDLKKFHEQITTHSERVSDVL